MPNFFLIQKSRKLNSIHLSPSKNNMKKTIILIVVVHLVLSMILSSETLSWLTALGLYAYFSKQCGDRARAIHRETRTEYLDHAIDYIFAPIGLFASAQVCERSIFPDSWEQEWREFKDKIPFTVHSPIKFKDSKPEKGVCGN